MSRSHHSQLSISQAGQDVLAEREGMRLTAYKDTVGVWTIGLGHTSNAGPPPVHEGMTITEDEAWEIFRRDNKRFRDECLPLIKAPLSQQEFDALASFIYNIGSTNFAKSTVLKRLNEGDYDSAGEAMLMWNKPPEVMNRRRGEHAQFLQGRYVARLDAKGNVA